MNNTDSYPLFDFCGWIDFLQLGRRRLLQRDLESLHNDLGLRQISDFPLHRITKEPMTKVQIEL